MALLDVQMVSIRVARVAFVTRRQAPYGGTQCDELPRVRWVTSACGRSQMQRIVCDSVIWEQSTFGTMHPHAGLIPAVCRLPLEIGLRRTMKELTTTSIDLVTSRRKFLTASASIAVAASLPAVSMAAAAQPANATTSSNQSTGKHTMSTITTKDG